MHKTVWVHQGSETTVAAALVRLRAEDEHVAGDAEAALGSLSWDQGPEAITQHGLQTFLWYELPRTWLTDLEGKLHIAASLGRLLELVGLPRYAAICRGPETTAVRRRLAAPRPELDGQSWLEVVAAERVGEWARPTPLGIWAVRRALLNEGGHAPASKAQPDQPLRG